MSSISIIGLGGMSRALGARAIASGHAVEVIGRDTARAQALAAELGGGDALAGKVVVDITNTSDADATGLATPEGRSGAQEIADALPAGAHVVKAFNTVFGHILARGGALDVLYAGDDEQAKASVSVFIESLGLCPLDAGGLAVARWLEGLGVVMISVANHGPGFDYSVGVTLHGEAR